MTPGYINCRQNHNVTNKEFQRAILGVLLFEKNYLGKTAKDSTPLIKSHEHIKSIGVTIRFGTAKGISI